MSDLRFGRSETNIRMVRTFAFFGSGHNITCTFACTRVTELGVVSVDVTKNETPCIYIHKSNKHQAKTALLKTNSIYNATLNYAITKSRVPILSNWRVSKQTDLI